MALTRWMSLIIAILLTVPTLILYRLSIILKPNRQKPSRRSRNDGTNTHLLVVLGSGGHTAEMLAMLQRAVSEKDKALHLDWTDFTHRTWIVSSGDSISAERAQRFENEVTRKDDTTSNLQSTKTKTNNYVIHTIPRARRIHQPLYTAPISSLQCLLACLLLLLKPPQSSKTLPSVDFPDVILCNGPATATILIFASIILRFFNVGGCHSRNKMRTVYIESWARVKKLSLSGTLLSHVVDRFIVQWPQLVRPGGKAEYLGVLV